MRDPYFGSWTRSQAKAGWSRSPPRYFDGLAEAEKDLKPAQLIAAADYASHVAEQLREMATEIRAEERARREAKRAEREERRAMAHASRWHVAEAQGIAGVRRRLGPSSGWRMAAKRFISGTVSSRI